MQALRAQPLTAAAFAPFGDVLEAPVEPGRAYFDDALANGRADARPSLSIARAGPSAAPVVARMMERHAFSSQSFMPLEACRWLVLVAPHGADGGPDMARAHAFLPEPGQGITFRMDCWHHSLTVLDRPASFAIWMWCDGTDGDQEFVDLAAPLRIELA